MQSLHVFRCNECPGNGLFEGGMRADHSSAEIIDILNGFYSKREYCLAKGKIVPIQVADS